MEDTQEFKPGDWVNVMEPGIYPWQGEVKQIEGSLYVCDLGDRSKLLLSDLIESKQCSVELRDDKMIKNTNK